MSHLHVSIFPVIKFGQVDTLQNGGDRNWSEEMSAHISIGVQFIVGLPTRQHNQLPQEQTEATVDKHLQTDIPAQVWIQLHAPVKVKYRIAIRVMLPWIGQD